MKSIRNDNIFQVQDDAEEGVGEAKGDKRVH